ncbi:MAG: tryptophan synthase subunit alpha, partial [Pseudomonadota bacterium]
QDARAAGVDGIICVDTPPEQDADCCIPATKHGLHFIRLVTPTSDGARISVILRNAGGFLYYVAITGITGTRQADIADTQAAIARLRDMTNLPLAAGFGIRSAQDVADVSQFANAAVVGSSIVEHIGNAHAQGKPQAAILAAALGCVSELARGIK